MPPEIAIKDLPHPFFKAILFDMDGTLVDTEPYWLVCETELMDEFGYAWTVQDQSNCLGGPLSKVGEYMHSLARYEETPEFFTNALVDRMVDKLKSGVALMQGAQSLLNLCMDLGIPIALVSASPRVLVDAAISDIRNVDFRISISSDDVTRVKPDPEGYLKAAEFLGVDISTCLVLEDSANGVTSAKASGAWVVAIPHLVPIQESERVATVSSVEILTLDYLDSLYKRWHS